MMPRLKDLDTESHVDLIAVTVRLGPIVMLGLMAVEYLVWGPRFIWFIIPDVALTALAIVGFVWVLHAFSRAAEVVYLGRGPGNEVSRQYSEQEALVIQGRHAEAADSYRAIIDADPFDNEARIRLARLLERECRDSPGAEASYLAVRESRPTPNQDWTAANGLIDLYERERNIPRLRQELARLGARYRASDVGATARRRLRELQDAATDQVVKPE
jgi:hypothetical protein